MIKKYSLLFLVFVSVKLFSQEIYFTTGKNYTKYSHKDANNQTDASIQKGSGNFYEMGFSKPLSIKNLFYKVGVAFNEYNALGSSLNSSYRWETQYLGAQGGLDYVLPTNTSAPKKGLAIVIGTALNLATIVYGKQEINGSYYNLMKQKEFSGLLLEPSIGLAAKYHFSSFGAISLGYNYCHSINITNDSDEKLSFNTNQLKLSLCFKID